MANFALVKSFPDAETEDEFKKQIVREAKEALGLDLDSHVLGAFSSGPMGMHGVTYPDLPWEPESFYAVARFYASH